MHKRLILNIKNHYLIYSIILDSDFYQERFNYSDRINGSVEEPVPDEIFIVDFR